MCLNLSLSEFFLLFWLGAWLRVDDCQTQLFHSETDQCALSIAVDFPWFLGCSAARQWAKPYQMIVLLGWYEPLSYVMLPKMFCRLQKWLVVPILVERLMVPILAERYRPPSTEAPGRSQSLCCSCARTILQLCIFTFHPFFVPLFDLPLSTIIGASDSIFLDPHPQS